MSLQTNLKNKTSSKKPSSIYVYPTYLTNYIRDDPLLDWLRMFGKLFGYISDEDRGENGSDKTLNLLVEYYKCKGIEYEDNVVKQITDFFGKNKIVDLTNEEGKFMNINKRIEYTKAAMETGKDVIFQAGVVSHEHKLYGIVDIVIRSDIFGFESNSNNDKGYEYFAIDIKNFKLDITKGGKVSEKKKNQTTISQLLVYTYALCEMQGIAPSVSQFGILPNNIDTKKTELPLPIFDLAKNDFILLKTSAYDHIWSKTLDAISWRQRLASEGATWNPETNYLDIPELMPNMNNEKDDPWKLAKKEISRKTDEITQIWTCNYKMRQDYVSKGVTSWKDMKFNPRPDSTLEKLLNLHRIPNNLMYTPRVLKNYESLKTVAIREDHPIEFYVDFETIGNLDDSMDIFMIGCYTHNTINGDTEFKQFVADKLNSESEAKIIDDWLEYMYDMRMKWNMTAKPRIYHWSNAEPSTYQKTFNKYTPAEITHDPEKCNLNYTDLLPVFRNEPIIIKGMDNYGIKSVAKALYNNKLITTDWGESKIANGQDAMFYSWLCYNDNVKGMATLGIDVKINKKKVFNEIKHYNMIDCKVMWDMMKFVRYTLKALK
jgi:hypothetical protein